MAVPGGAAGAASSAGAATRDPLPMDVIVGLQDKSEDRRRRASERVQMIVRDYLGVNDEASIRQMLNVVSHTLINGSAGAGRAGGVLALAAASTTMGSRVAVVLDIVVPSILQCFGDERKELRFAACEALYNVAKVARTALLRPDFFRLIFVGVCSMVADPADAEVRRAAWMLSMQLLEIATSVGEHFDVPLLLDLVRAQVDARDPFISQVLVQWITQLDSVPGVDMVDYLPSFLRPMLTLLQDSNREVRANASKALRRFLGQLQSMTETETQTRINFPAITEILAEATAVPDELTRVTATDWLINVLRMGGKSLADEQSALLLRVVFRAVADPNATVVTNAIAVNHMLSVLVHESARTVDVRSLVPEIIAGLAHTSTLTRRCALAWVTMLLDKESTALMASADDILIQVLRILSSDCDDDELSLHIQVLALMSRPGAGGADFRDQMIGELIELFRNESNKLLERRGSYIIRHLCVVMDPTRAFLTIAKCLGSTEHDEFSYLVVEILSLLLMTAPELGPLRRRLQPSAAALSLTEPARTTLATPSSQSASTAEESGSHVFVTLFTTWCRNPVSAILLCFLAEEYRLAGDLVRRLALEPLTVGTLMQLDRAVQLLESPAFLQLRLHLCEPERPDHRDLLGALYGILMVLPQSTAFHTLRDRLTSVTSLHIGLAMAPARPAATASSAPRVVTEIGPLLHAFAAAQQDRVRRAEGGSDRDRDLGGPGAAADAAALNSSGAAEDDRDEARMLPIRSADLLAPLKPPSSGAGTSVSAGAAAAAAAAAASAAPITRSLV